MEGAVFTLVEIADSDQCLLGAEVYDHILSAKARLGFDCVFLGGFNMTTALELHPDLSWLVYHHLEGERLDCDLVVAEVVSDSGQLLLEEIHFLFVQKIYYTLYIKGQDIIIWLSAQ